jgi:hypothetical protein
MITWYTGLALDAVGGGSTTSLAADNGVNFIGSATAVNSASTPTLAVKSSFSLIPPRPWLPFLPSPHSGPAAAILYVARTSSISI